MLLTQVISISLFMLVIMMEGVLFHFFLAQLDSNINKFLIDEE